MPRTPGAEVVRERGDPECTIVVWSRVRPCSWSPASPRVAGARRPAPYRPLRRQRPPRPRPTAAPPETVAPSPTEAAGGEDVSAILAPAVLATLDAGSATFDIGITFNDSSVIPPGTSMTGGGPMEFGEGGRGAMELDLTSLGAGKFAMITDPPVLYMAISGAPSSIIPEGKWARIDEDSTSPIANQLRGVFSGANDASAAIRYLLGSDGTGSIGDPETINGVQATPVTTAVDLEAARDATTDPNAKAAIQELIDQQVASASGRCCRPWPGWARTGYPPGRPDLRARHGGGRRLDGGELRAE